MRIEYHLTPEDWAAFGERCAQTAPGFRRSARVGRIMGMIVILIVAVGQASRSGSFIWLAAGMLAAVGWAWYWPRYIVAHVRAHMRDREQPCLRGPHLMEALPEGLRAECDIAQSTVRWAGVRSVDETATHIFVMLTDVQGYVIPKARVEIGNVEAFLAEMRHCRASSSVAS